MSIRTLRAPTTLARGRLGLLNHSVWLRLVGLGALLELWLWGLMVFVAGPFGREEFTRSPLAARWPVMADTARLIFSPSWLSRAFVLNKDWLQVVILALLFYGAALIAALACALAKSLSQPGQRHLFVILGGALLLGGTFLLIPGFPTQDIFSYIFYGRMAVLHHANPLTAVPNQFPNDPFLSTVFWRNTPSVYGPTWLALSDVLTWLAEAWGGSLATYVFLFKSTSLLFHLANAAVIWSILTVLAPQRRVMGTLLYAWNQLALLEFAGSGHNDAVMLFFFLLGVWSLVRNHELLALLAFALALDTKFILLILLPFYFWYVVRELPPAAMVRGALWRLGLLFGVCACFYLPYWDGLHTLSSLISSPPTQGLRDSLLEMIDWPLRQVLARLPGWSEGSSAALALVIMKALAGLIFLVAWLRLFPGVRSRKRLFLAWWWALFLYLSIASGWFVPWYGTWLLAVAAFYPLDDLTTATQLLTGGVLILYVLDPLPLSSLHGIRALLAFGPAIIYLLWRRFRAQPDRAATRQYAATA